jgi:hypothetical protein
VVDITDGSDEPSYVVAGGGGGRSGTGRRPRAVRDGVDERTGKDAVRGLSYLKCSR